MNREKVLKAMQEIADYHDSPVDAIPQYENDNGKETKFYHVHSFETENFKFVNGDCFVDPEDREREFFIIEVIEKSTGEKCFVMFHFYHTSWYDDFWNLTKFKIVEQKEVLVKKWMEIENA